MGKVVGDYIHLKKENYLRYGTNFQRKSTQTPEKALDEAHERIINNYKNTQKPQTLTAISNYFNFLFDPKLGMELTKLDKKQYKELQDKVVEYLYKNVLDPEKYGIAFSRLQAYAKNVSVGGKNRLGETWTSAEKIFKFYKKIMSARDEIIIMAKKNPNMEFLQKKINNLEKIIQELSKNCSGDTLEDQFSDFLGKHSRTIGNYARIEAEDLVGEDGTSLATLLNEIYAYVSGNSVANAMGELGENLLPEIMKVIQDHVEFQESEFLKGLKVEKRGKSSQRVTHVTLSQNVLGGDKTKYQPKNYVTKIGNVEVNVAHQVEEKIDMSITIDGSSIGTSIKNYNPAVVESKGVGILKGANLLNYISNDINFTNHYLNITSKHSDGDINADLLKQAHDVFRLKMAATALAGGLYVLNKDGSIGKEEEAQLFIINKQKGGRANFEVYTIESLLSKIEQNYDLVKMKGYDTQWDNTKVKIRNSTGKKRYKAAYQRCINILQQLRTFSFSVELQPAIFD